MIHRKSTVVLGLLLSTTLAACVPVKAYERGKLAHPTMSTSPMGGPGEEHMHSIQEGSTGGDTGGGGGCGCN
jgi:Domain of unknown function (DUF4266)